MTNPCEHRDARAIEGNSAWCPECGAFGVGDGRAVEWQTPEGIHAGRGLEVRGQIRAAVHGLIISARGATTLHGARIMTRNERGEWEKVPRVTSVNLSLSVGEAARVTIEQVLMPGNLLPVKVRRDIPE